MSQAIEFLLINNSPADIRLIHECFKHHKLTNSLQVVKDTKQARRYLERQGKYHRANPPDVILMDTETIHNDGQLLQYIKSEPSLENMQIVVLTAFAGEEAILDTGLPISLFVSKPVNFESLRAIVKHSDQLGFSIGVDTEAQRASSSS